jgi:hypothetical protein
LLYCTKKKKFLRIIKLYCFLTGFPKYPQEKNIFIDIFLEEGYKVLLPMYSGTFDSPGKFSIENSVSDAKEWYDFLINGELFYNFGTQIIKHTFNEIIIFGVSFGGLIAGLLLKTNNLINTRRSYLVSSLWGMSEFKQDTLHRQIALENRAILKYAFPLSYRFESMDDFFAKILGEKEINITQKSEKLPNIIIVNGKQDVVTPNKMSELLHSSFPDSKLELIEGGHSSKIDSVQLRKILQD